MKTTRIRRLSIVAAILAAGILGLAILHNLPESASPLPIDAVFDLVAGDAVDVLEGTLPLPDPRRPSTLDASW